MLKFKCAKRWFTVVAVAIFAGCTSLIANAECCCCEHEGIAQESVSVKNGDFEISKDGILQEYYGKNDVVCIPEGVKKISFAVFFNHDEIKQVICPTSLEIIDEFAFFGCTKLEKVELPRNLKSISRLAFGNCTSLQKIELPFGVKEVDLQAFLSCSSLQKIDVCQENEHFCSVDGMLYNKKIDTLICCPNGKSGVAVVPESVINIGEFACFNCKNLTKIEVKGPLKNIGDGAFYDCGNLTEIKLGNSVEHIGTYAFGRCLALKQITIPKTVIEIKDNAFSETNLERIFVLSKNVKLPEELKDMQLTIVTYEDSRAKDFAVENALGLQILE